MRVVPVGLYAVINEFICGISFPPPAQLVSFASQQPEKLLLELCCALVKRHVSLCLCSILVNRAVWVSRKKQASSLLQRLHRKAESFLAYLSFRIIHMHEPTMWLRLFILFFITDSCYFTSCLCAILSGEIQNLWINRHLASRLKL